MKALQFQRSIPRFAAARVAGALLPGRGAEVGPLRLTDIDPPGSPGPGWHRVRPLLSGICGSDLATVDAVSSSWFEPIVSFPFVPGHEIVGQLDDGARVVVEPVLACAARDIHPVCDACQVGETQSCEHIAHGHLRPGLQTGYCADTGGGWSVALVAHESQLHPVPDELSDEQAVMVEPAACAIHAANTPTIYPGDTVVVIGAGTIGLGVIAAVHALEPDAHVIATAKYAEQRALATRLGADEVVAPGGLIRAVRRRTGSMMTGNRLASGVGVVFDCVGSADSLAQALAVTRPQGEVVLVGMAGQTTVDLTPLWQREIRLSGAYAYGTEMIDRDGKPYDERRTFDLAFELVARADLGRLVGATYPLDRYREALAHAADAGRRGTVKVAFDLRGERERDRL